MRKARAFAHGTSLTACRVELRGQKLLRESCYGAPKKSVSTGSHGASTNLYDGFHRISNGQFIRLRVYALRPVSMDERLNAPTSARRKLGGRSSVPPFDIFKKQPGGGLRWLEVVADLEAAKLRVKELVECVPGEYFIFSLASGRRLDVKRDDVPWKNLALVSMAGRQTGNWGITSEWLVFGELGCFRQPCGTFRGISA